jgi:hypothetical protein
MPECDISVLLVNDPSPGGSGGSTLVTSINAFSAEIVTHELGHTFAGLGDEYGDPFPGYPDIEEPNTTQETNRASIKWNAWILPTTPVPTPDIFEHEGEVGLFEGAHYHATGWYRPKHDCMMRSLGSEYCEVCREATVRAIYGLVAPIESVSPVSSEILFENASSSQGFQVIVLEPVSGTTAVQWLTNGVPIPGATNTSFNVSAEVLGRGNHTVAVVVRDTTDLVRTDPAGLLHQTNTWTVSVPGAGFRFQTVEFVDARFTLVVSGEPGERYALEHSSSFTNWTLLGLLTNVRGTVRYVDVESDPGPRFYRLKLAP